jgi:hypothetical protein
MPGFFSGFNRLRPGLAPLVFDEEAWRAKISAQDPSLLYAPHRKKNGVFFNPWYPQPHKTWWRILRWWASRSSAPGHAPERLGANHQ